jgi:hypothetical protein
LCPKTGSLLQRGWRFRASGTKTGFAPVFTSERRNSHAPSEIYPRFAALAMSKTCPPGQKSDHTYLTVFEQLWEIRPEDIEEGWICVMTKRLLKELNRQISSIEATKIDKTTSQPGPQERALNAKTLATLEQTLERLARLEKQRDAMLESKKGRTYASARDEIQRKFDKRASRGGKTKQS